MAASAGTEQRSSARPTACSTASGPLYAEAIACTERSGDLLTEQALHNNAGVFALKMGDIPVPGPTWKPQCGWPTPPATSLALCRRPGDINGALLLLRRTADGVAEPDCRCPVLR
jgi:hypothetical protein